jgi:ferrochelatase
LNNKTGVLLLNLGTPSSFKFGAVAKFLRQFLSDYRVIELPGLLRWLLVNIVIIPFRTSKTAAAYKKIWLKIGSPLLVNTKRLKDKLAADLGANYVVGLGMRYGEPSIQAAVQELAAAGVTKIIIMPLFPQYSSAATGSAVEQALRQVAKLKVIPKLEVKPPYFQEPHFIEALALTVRPFLRDKFDFLLMSYHGLPEQQMQHSENFVCDMSDECPTVFNKNTNCYRAQCYQTSRLLAHNLQLAEYRWGVSFQSRLGRLPWIKPYTEEVLIKLRQSGVKRLVVCCPSFVADCLETLEEIGIRAKQQWQELGGETFHLVPCLNAHEIWAKALASIVCART